VDKRRGFWAFAYDYRFLFLIMGIIPWGAMFWVLYKLVTNGASLGSLALGMQFGLTLFQVGCLAIVLVAIYKEEYT